jgi:transaldolase
LLTQETTMNPTRRLHELGQRLWLDDITRALIDDGTLARCIEELSVTGLTSNPTIFAKAIGEGSEYDRDIRDGSASGLSDKALFLELALADLRRAADLFRPTFDATAGVDGWVSMEVSPLLAGDTQGSIEAAARIHRLARRPNLFVKIPGTPEGIPAIEESIAAGVPINVTLLFSSEQYVAAAEAYMRGLERRLAAGQDARVPSVASLFVSRWDRKVNEQVPAELGDRLGIAVAQRTYRAHRRLLESPRWRSLAAAGARPQRLLWASTGTKDPRARDTLYIEALAAPGTITTMPMKTLLAFADHGTVAGEMAPDGGDAESVLDRFQAAGVDVVAVASELLQEGTAAFVRSWQSLLERIGERRAASASEVRV